MPRLQSFLVALTLFPSISLAVTPAKVPPNGKAHGFISSLDNPYPPPTGDWLTSTFCYCHSPKHAKEKSDFEKAHIFQHEYYNYHSNATFIADHICLARAGKNGDQCNRINAGGDSGDWFLEQYYEPDSNREYYTKDSPYVCKKFPRTEEEKTLQANSPRSTRMERRRLPVGNNDWHDPGAYGSDPESKSSHPDHDSVCFITGKSFYGKPYMGVKFNKQRREMTKKGQSGRVKTGFKEVQGMCEDMCQSRFKMPVDMKIKEPRAEGGSRQYIYTSLKNMCDNCK